jgi:hypothetical protein
MAKRRSSALSPQTRRLLKVVATKILKQERQEPITRPDAGRMARYLVSVLVPRRLPGKKATPAVVTATALKLEGKSWPAIYACVFDNYANMPGYERNWQCYRLRRAVAAIFRRRRLRQGKRARRARVSDAALSAQPRSEGPATKTRETDH